MILDKAKSAFDVEADDCFYFFVQNNKKIDMSYRGTTFSNFEFVNDQYDVATKEVRIIPYTVDTASYSKVNGYVAIRMLKVK